MHHHAEPQATTATPRHHGFVVNIITRLSGEAGNWLLSIARAKVLQWRLEKLGIASDIRYQVRQNKQKKCMACIDFITTCFPNLRDLDFDTVKLSHPNFLKRAMTKRQAWYDESISIVTDGGGGGMAALIMKPPDIHEGATDEEEDATLLQLRRLIMRQTSVPLHYDPSVRNMSIPFLHVEPSFARPRDYNDYYRELRDYLQVDDKTCCADALLPDPDVSVFHFRGYRAEESLAESKQKGREELSPNKVATKLFGHLHSGDRVVILSRLNETSPLVQDHVTTLVASIHNKPPLSVQVVHQTPFRKDFCYLRHAQKELVGMGYSTFVRLAGLLVKYQPKVRLYCLDSPDTRRLETRQQVGCRHFDFQDHPRLQELYSDEVYRSEEMDEELLKAKVFTG